LTYRWERLREDQRQRIRGLVEQEQQRRRRRAWRYTVVILLVVVVDLGLLYLVLQDVIL
jgi:hypothetical protein